MALSLIFAKFEFFASICSYPLSIPDEMGCCRRVFKTEKKKSQASAQTFETLTNSNKDNYQGLYSGILILVQCVIYKAAAQYIEYEETFSAENFDHAEEKTLFSTTE